MRKVTLGAAALLAGSALGISGLPGGPLPARPAMAQSDGAFIEWQSPDEGARLSGSSIHIKAKVSDRRGVQGWVVEVAAPDGADYPGWGTLCEKSESRAPSYVSIDCLWNTTAYPDDRGPAQNRAYAVRISTKARPQNGTLSSDRQQTAERSVVVANPVSPPRDVRLAFADATGQATVRWAANREPDIVSYVIQERIGDGPWKKAGQSPGSETTFTRTLSTPGTYRYQVAALRSGGSGDDTIQSSWSAPAAEPKQIVVAEPSRPETSTATTQPPAGSPGDAGQPSGPAPATPAPPAPSTAASPDPRAPAAPSAPTPASDADAGRSGAMVTPIAPGAPGSVKSGGATVGGTTARPSKAPKAPKEVEAPEGPDPGFSPELPYKQAGESTEENTEAAGRVLVGLPESIGGNETRRLVVPLAGGLLLFVFAMHVFYASRRVGPEAQLPLDID